MSRLLQSARSRRGNYAMFAGGSIGIFLGFGALSVDLSYLRLAQRQAQDVADAAAQAALFELRRTDGNATQAKAAANYVVGMNNIVGAAGDMDTFELGQWVDSDSDGKDDTFCSASNCAQDANAARVTVTRKGINSVQMMLGRVFGLNTADVAGVSTASTRRLETIVVMDITNSWAHTNFHKAREAALAYGDYLAGTAGPDDQIGMAVFTGRWGIERSPLASFSTWQSTWRPLWANVETGSKAINTIPDQAQNNHACPNSGRKTATGSGGAGNNYPPDEEVLFDAGKECWPGQFREFKDENGTDHHIGLEMVEAMFTNSSQSGAYRAIVLLTDGQPAVLGNGGEAGSRRVLAGAPADNKASFVYRYFSVADATALGNKSIEELTQDVAARLETNWNANIWFVSYRDCSSPGWMQNSSKGDGFFKCANNSSEIISIFQDIAESLPVVTVQ